VENALEQLLAAPKGIVSATEVRNLLETWQDLAQESRHRAPLPVDLQTYDDLLESPLESSKEQPAPQVEVTPNPQNGKQNS